MQLSSHELWDKLEESLINIRDDKNFDPILRDRIDSLLNHYNGNITKGNTTAVIDAVKVITRTLSQDSYYRMRNMTKEEHQTLTELKEDLLLFEKVLVQESRMPKEKEEGNKKDRLPNIDSERAMNLYK